MAQAVAAKAVATGKLQRTDVDENVLGFLEDLCDPERFACVRMALEA